MKERLYSIRMHATRGGDHLSGAERIADGPDLERLAADMVRRAMNHVGGTADAVRLSLDLIPHGQWCFGRLPDVSTRIVDSYLEGRRIACRLLEESGVTGSAARAAITDIDGGAAPGGGNMRGAMLVDAESGERLETDPARGVRASRMDLTPAAERQLRSLLAEAGLDNEHVREAMVLSAKVLATPGIVAELCWSDDPDYTAGYVAFPAGGYRRLTHLKPAGDSRGGRAFFLRRAGLDLDAVLHHLEKSVMLIDTVGIIHRPVRGE
jgi:6-carboxyhexanoate--CoA ligase